MKDKLAALEPHIHRLTRRAAESGLSVTVVVKPVLCPLDEHTAVMDGWFGSMMGTVAGRSSMATAAVDIGPVDDLVARVEKLEARKCNCPPEKKRSLIFGDRQ